MEWVECLNRTITYMEDRLTEEIDYEALARLACCSSYHYQRMFAYMAGVSLGEYIRRRRMSRAAEDLQAGEKVLDTALRYGYQSPTAFNRAFQAVHGVPPSAVREPGVSVKSFPPLRFTVMIKGAEEMEYRIEKREAFRVVGVSVPIEKDMEKNFQTLPALWERVARDGTLQRLLGMMDAQPAGILGVCDCPDGGQWRYYVAAASTGGRGSGDVHRSRRHLGGLPRRGDQPVHSGLGAAYPHGVAALLRVRVRQRAGHRGLPQPGPRQRPVRGLDPGGQEGLNPPPYDRVPQNGRCFPPIRQETAACHLRHGGI